MIKLKLLIQRSKHIFVCILIIIKLIKLIKLIFYF